MEQLTHILQDATAAIGREYFLLPIHGADPVYRERVYCYELYHQKAAAKRAASTRSKSSLITVT